jgi:hypothetical protein
MHFTNAVAAASLLAVQACAWTPSQTNGTDRLAQHGLANLKRHHAYLNSTTNCTIETAAVRKEWLSLSDDEKIAYTDAVKCLMDKPSISGSAIPGAMSRFDDFVGVHINQTLSIHATVRDNLRLRDTPLLTYSRATSCHGIATSLGLGNTHYVKNAATKASSPTSTGESTRTTSLARLFSTAVRLRLAATESTSHTTAPVFLPTLLRVSSYRRAMDLDVSPLVLSRT